MRTTTALLLILTAVNAQLINKWKMPIDQSATYYTEMMLDDRALGQPCPAATYLQCDHEQDSSGQTPNYYYCSEEKMVWTKLSCGKYYNCMEKPNLLGRFCRFRFSPWVIVGQDVKNKKQ
jgi:hypothetical protein